jgi:putative ABC transport system permease protein
LSLTVHERTREIGLLRVVGMDRSQTRRMVRWEAVVIALFGTAVGTVVGIAAAWALVRALRTEGIGSFALPWRGLVGLALLAFASGVVAAVAPARRAARLDVLEAVAVT